MPGTTIRERTAQVSRSQPVLTGTGFLAGRTDRGPSNSAEKCLSLAEWQRKFGGPIAASTSQQEVEQFFAKGGAVLWFARIVGVAPVSATVVLLDAGGVAALRATVTGPGAWANAYNLAVEAGDAAGEFKLRLTHDTDATVNELSPSFADQTAAIAWAATNEVYHLATQASAADPAVVAAQSFAGGTEDAGSISDATALAALSLFRKSYGPGQVGYIGRFTATANGQLADHAKDNNRVAIYTGADSVSKATWIAHAAVVRGLPNGRHGAAFGPWVNVPAATTGAPPVALPPTALVMGRIARNDSQGHTANEPSAGDLGVLEGVDSLRADFSDIDVNDLNAAALNPLIEMDGTHRIYGYRSGVAKASNPDWWQFGNVRLYMQIAAEADRILERFVLRQIDGKGLLFAELEGVLTKMVLHFYEAGSLYGRTPGEAFFVDTSPAINTAETIRNAEIHAAIELTMSSMGENVILDIIKRQIGA